MKVIGLTGGIGSGKTYVSGLFAALGVSVYISDIEAKRIMNIDITVKKAIVELFGKEAYLNETLNREFIAKKVFSNKELLARLNAIVHPAVTKDFENWKASQSGNFVIKESAILFETDGYKKCDQTILVTAPKSVRIKRVTERDGVTVEEVDKRMANQWPDEKKIPLADYIIENEFFNKTESTVLKIYEYLKN